MLLFIFVEFFLYSPQLTSFTMLFFSLVLVAHVRVEFVILYGENISKDGVSPMGAEYKLGCSAVDVIAANQGLESTHRSMSILFVGDFAQGRKLQALTTAMHEAGDLGESQG